MPTNKNAVIRYCVLDRCFRNSGRMYFIEDLLEACNSALYEFNGDEGIKKRQLYDDIRFMESDQGWSVPLERLHYGRKVYYRYSDLGFSINNQPLNKTEVEQIKSALAVLSRFAGSPQFQWVNEIIPTLKDKFGLSERPREVMLFDANIDLKGIHFITPIFNAIVNERVLKVLYKDFKNPEAYKVILHPHVLKQYSNRWFVLGYNEGYDKNCWNLAIDRIVNLEETDGKFRKNDVDWEEYFFDIIGVTRPEGGEVWDVKLHFTPSLAPYIKTKPLHPTQKHKEKEDTGLEVVIKVIPNYELEKLILSFGEGVRVLVPDELRMLVADRLKNAVSKYE